MGGLDGLPMGAVGVFDSGVGGLSVLGALREVLPQESFIYCADQAHIPYGRRSAAEVLSLSLRLTQFLVSVGVKLIVVACNTATAVAIDTLRATYPQVSFVGMEPALKPAVANTKSGVMGVLATANTFRSQRYMDLRARFAPHVTVLESPCRGLVEVIEQGELDTLLVEGMLAGFTQPMLAQGADVFILGCTHYPLVKGALRRVVGGGVTVIDPSTAVARQAKRLLEKGGNTAVVSTPSYTFLTTGEPQRLESQLLSLWKLDVLVRPLII